MKGKNAFSVSFGVFQCGTKRSMYKTEAYFGCLCLLLLLRLQIQHITMQSTLLLTKVIEHS